MRTGLFDFWGEGLSSMAFRSLGGHGDTLLTGIGLVIDGGVTAFAFLNMPGGYRIPFKGTGNWESGRKWASCFRGLGRAALLLIIVIYSSRRYPRGYRWEAPRNLVKVEEPEATKGITL